MLSGRIHTPALGISVLVALSGKVLVARWWLAHIDHVRGEGGRMAEACLNCRP